NKTHPNDPGQYRPALVIGKGDGTTVVSHLHGIFGLREPGRSNRNTVSITGAVNSVTVTHGLTDVLAPTIVTITPLQDSGDVWVTNKTTAQFTINFDVQPGAATWYFDWYAEV
ncbi:MAG: hypothetical protein Q8J76_14930, partial [Desulfobulbaceae bacterium]|nr:hypothetical protein [Desulfobulbaceae bacterium]